MDAILKQELTEVQKQAWDQLQVTASYGGHTHTLNVVALKLGKCIVEAEARANKEKADISDPNPHFGKIGVLAGEVKSFRGIPFPRRISYEIPPFATDLAVKESLTTEPTLRTDDRMPTLEEFKAEFLSPPELDGYSVIESKGFLVWMKREDMAPDDLLCFYDGDKRAVLTPIQHKAVLDAIAHIEKGKT